MSRSSATPIAWPEGARFAFTIFDDTDMTTLANGPPVYDLLGRLGLTITKSVWPVAPSGPPLTGGTTCADPEYLAWVLELQAAGHEIGFHNASDHSSTRHETIAALDRFRDLFGHDPRIGADHAGNREAVYLGAARLSGPRAALYRWASQLARPDQAASEGHVPSSPYHWADVLAERVEYWRSFTFHDLDAFDSCPKVPYHDAERPAVPWWFTSTHAPTLEPFLAALSPERLDALEASGGVGIIYTHFGVDFVRAGAVDPRVARTLEDLASRDVWCAPTSTVLDHIRSQRRTSGQLRRRERSRMENRWIAHQVRARFGSELRKALDRRRR